VTHHKTSGLVELVWDPVATDVEGGPEYVARYHVYRFPRAETTPQAAPYRVTTTEQTSVTLPVSDAGEPAIWFYRVTAEDLAGNEAGRIE
jgi:hypothetical protein